MLIPYLAIQFIIDNISYNGMLYTLICTLPIIDYEIIRFVISDLRNTVTWIKFSRKMEQSYPQKKVILIVICILSK